MKNFKKKKVILNVKRGLERSFEIYQRYIKYFKEISDAASFYVLLSNCYSTAPYACNMKLA